MDMSKLSDSDLRALAAGDMSKVSNEALTYLSGAEPDLRATAAPVTPKPPSMVSSVNQGIGNVLAGAVRGAGSIGATLLTPVDYAAKKLGIQNDYIGRDDRRTEMDSGLKTMGAEPDSWAYKGGKLAGEIAGTSGVGGLLAKPLQALSTARGASPALTGAIEALQTGGLKAGNMGWSLPGALTRTAGGAATGAATAGLVNPEDAGTGAMIGGAMPLAMRGMGAVGSSIGNVWHGPEASPEMLSAIRAARESGYVIPPTQAKPTLTNRLMEGFAGKLTTAQNASAKNAEVTDSLAAKALGLEGDTKLSPELLQNIRKRAGNSYESIGSAGTITPGNTYEKALDGIVAPHLKAAQGFPDAAPSPVLKLVDSLRSPSFDASSAVAKIKELRTAAEDAFRSGNTDVGRASKAGAKALEDAIEQHLDQTGATDLLKNFRDARQLIAKTYSVENALNKTTGSVDAKKLGAMVDKGKPLTGELRMAADFANRFPKAAQTVEKMGSLPQTSPLDWGLAGAIGASTAHPAALAGVVMRPAMRALSLSKLVQNGLANQGQQGAISRVLQNPEGQQLLYRAAPVLGAQD